MPEFSRFFGVIITMFCNDHEPPHFHVRYGAHKALIGLDSLDVLVGSLPSRVMGLVLEWVVLHRDELRDWNRAKAKEPLLPPTVQTWIPWSFTRLLRDARCKWHRDLTRWLSEIRRPRNERWPKATTRTRPSRRTRSLWRRPLTGSASNNQLASTN